MSNELKNIHGGVGNKLIEPKIIMIVSIIPIQAVRNTSKKQQCALVSAF